MTAINTKNTRIRLVTAGGTPVVLVPTAISSAAPAEVTVADTTGITEGDVVELNTVGFDELNDALFVVTNVTATTFELLGSDTSATTGTLAASPTATVYPAGDEVPLCLASIDIAAPSVNQIDVGTFCDPEANLPGRTTLGTITMTGFAEKTDTGLAELIVADEDGADRIFKVIMSQDQGYLIGKIAFSGLAIQIPLEGAYGYTITGTQTSKIKWVHD